jgi:hypothetical protein
MSLFSDSEKNPQGSEMKRCANSELIQGSKMDRFRLVGAGEQRGWDCYDERLRGLQVDHQLA